MDAITLRNRGQRFAGSAALDRLGSLVSLSLRLRPNLMPAAIARASGLRQCVRKLPLELSDGRQERLPTRRKDHNRLRLVSGSEYRMATRE
jgi:hypothetical protein